MLEVTMVRRDRKKSFAHGAQVSKEDGGKDQREEHPHIKIRSDNGSFNRRRYIGETIMSKKDDWYPETEYRNIGCMIVDRNGMNLLRIKPSDAR